MNTSSNKSQKDRRKLLLDVGVRRKQIKLRQARLSTQLQERNHPGQLNNYGGIFPDVGTAWAVAKQTRHVFDTRIQMLAHLPKGGVVCEIGVFAGDFAESMLEILCPEKLVLLDAWEGQIYCADPDGRNGRRLAGGVLENSVRRRFARRQQVEIIKGRSTTIMDYPDSYFDAIYIDADHSYQGAKLDLENAFVKVRLGGMIMGHDFANNPNKCRAKYGFGVQQAVLEFLQKHNQRIYALAMDGSVSFCIKKG